MNINLNYLKTFSELSKTLSFSQTAKNLSVAQPAISRQIKELENQLGLSLFIRDNKKVKLTAQGQKLKQDIAPLLTGISESINSVIEKDDEVSGTIRFACPREAGELLILPIISKFKKNYPLVNFEITLTKVSEVPQKILDGSLDAGICITPLDHENLRFYQVLKQESFLLTNKKTKAVNNISKMSFVGYRKTDPLLEKFIKSFYPRTSMSKVNLPLTINSHRAIVDYLLVNNDYYAVLPYYSLPVKEAVDKGKLQIIGKKSLESNLYLAVAQLNYTPKRNLIFQEFLMKELKGVN